MVDHEPFFINPRYSHRRIVLSNTWVENAHKYQTLNQWDKSGGGVDKRIIITFEYNKLHYYIYLLMKLILTYQI